MPMSDPVRASAVRVPALLAATIAVGVLLLVLFEPEVQTVDAEELVARRDDARSFLIADYVFVVLYGVLSPLAIWRFGTSAGAASRAWVRLPVLLLPAAGLVDAVENGLLLSATGSVSSGRVDAAHALEVPKVVLFVAATAFALVANVQAVRALRAGRR